MKKRALFLSLLSLAFIAGCGGNVFEGQEDKGSTEAERFDISDKLDSGDYLAVLNDPNATATDYAAAAMGYAGLDPVDLVKSLNDASTGSGSRASNVLVATGSLKIAASSSACRDSGLGPVACLPLNPDALHYLQKTKLKLDNALEANPTDADLNFQMVLTSLVDTLIALAQVGDTNLDEDVFNPRDGITESEATVLGEYIVDYPDVQVDADGDGVSETDLVVIIADDVADVVNSLRKSGLGSGSDLYEVLSEATEGEGSLDHDGNGTVTAPDISNYLNEILGE